MKATITFLLLFLGLGLACKKSPEGPTTLQMRVQNGTSYVISDILIDTTGTLSDSPGPNAVSFGTLNPEEKSEYVTFAQLYSYAWVRLVMKGTVYVLKPYDYTGEKPLANGKYTYRIGYRSLDDQLTLTLVVD